MFALHPPSDPFLINTTLFGLPIAVRWYGVLIVGGAMVAGWISARRAKRRGFDPEHIWNLLLLGMVLGIIGARLYYVAFEWQSFANRPLIDLINKKQVKDPLYTGLDECTPANLGKCPAK